TPAPDASGSPGGPAGRGPGFRGRGGGPGAGLFGGILGGPGRPFGAIHITGIDGSNVSLATDDGWKRTIAIGSDTTIMRAGETISVSDLKVGDEVRLVETRTNDGSYTITRLDVVLPSVAGQVTAVGSGTITVKRLDGTTATIHVGSDTTYVARGNGNASLSDVTVGSEVLAQGSARDDGSIDAVRVAIGRPTIVEGGRGPGFRFGPQGPKGQGGNPASPSPSTSASGA
ncbi:MAG TPA: DUF5666 domain-containing protein, partial [Candidatus Limnocylindrales bacterium]